MFNIKLVSKFDKYSFSAMCIVRSASVKHTCRHIAVCTNLLPNMTCYLSSRECHLAVRFQCHGQVTFDLYFSHSYTTHPTNHLATAFIAALPTYEVECRSAAIQVVESPTQETPKNKSMTFVDALVGLLVLQCIPFHGSSSSLASG